MHENYKECLEILSAQFEEINGCAFYHELFPDNESTEERYQDFSHPNAIYLYKDDDDLGTRRRLRRRIMLDDTWESDYTDFVEHNPMTLCSGLTYRRRSNTMENAQCMNALVIDLDGVGATELNTLLLRVGGDPELPARYPLPTFVVLSGSGIHIYFAFDKPIDLYPNIKLQLKKYKYELTYRMWEYKATSKIKQIQYHGINQGFRMVGSLNQKYGTEVKAFRSGERVTLEYMNQYVKPEFRVDVNKPFKPSQMTRKQAHEAYPEWYQRVIVEGDKRIKKWDIAGKQGDKLYQWWLRKADEMREGHRYFYLMCMAIYACKCDVPKKQLREDMKDALIILNRIPHAADNDLTEDDIESAIEAYSKEYYNFTLDDIEKLCDLRIERNKRNGQKQSDHLEEARAIRDIRMKRQGRNWRDGNGRPSARQTVLDYRQANPEATKAECNRATGLDPKTIRKWWSCPPGFTREDMKQMADWEYYLCAGQTREEAEAAAREAEEDLSEFMPEIQGRRI